MIAFTPWEHVAERLNIFTAIVVKIQSQRKSMLILILNTFVVKGPGLASVLVGTQRHSDSDWSSTNSVRPRWRACSAWKENAIGSSCAVASLGDQLYVHVCNVGIGSLGNACRILPIRDWDFF